MLRLLLKLALLCAPLALVAAMAAADEKKDDQGFVQLFNGKDLTGWKMYSEPNKRDIGEITKKEQDGKVVAFIGKLKKTGDEVPLWRVEDGLLIGSGPHSHLFSERDDYQNFVYRVEVMINDKGNSGQYFRTQFGQDFPKGYEAQINSTHGDPIRSGSLYPAFGNPKEDREKIINKKQLHKPDEWFAQEVIADGNHIVIKVKDDSGATPGKVKTLTVTGVHNCCQQCCKLIKAAVKKVPGVTGDTAKPRENTFEVTGDFDAAELVKTLNEAGFHAKVKK